MELVLTDFLDRAVRLYGKKEAIIDQDGSAHTYEGVNRRVQQLSHGLASLGVTKGDRVAYLASNTLEMFEGFYGVFQTGATMVSLNTRLKPEDYRYILDHSGSKVLFVDYELVPLIEPIKDQLETVEHILVHGRTEADEGMHGYETWLASFSDSPFKRADVKEDDTATLLYTSGTTGNPKGVMLTHRNNYLHALSIQHHLRVSDRDTLIHILPMFHVNGWGSPFYYTANGATQVMQKKVIPEEILEKAGRYDATVMHMAPTVLNGLISKYHETKPDVPENLRLVIAGSAPPKAFVKEIEEEIGWEFYQVYGMTESSPLSTASYISTEEEGLEGDAYYEAKAKAGLEVIGTKVRVVDETGEEVKRDGTEVGEVIVKGPGVMKGYWRNEEETNRTIQNDWLYTGDMGTIDEHGRVAITDRKKDIIISGGENISSIEVESVFYDHANIQEAAVIALPHEKWGETPHAIIVLKEGAALTEEDVIHFSREKLAHFKCPTSVTFVDELPKTASGKIQKVKLRNLVGENR
ncbi:long-chain-fatty-acid--CoA ligase [Salimicrobium sp. PL1-032A]|uniref:long-chain-fatty-acid--CoA ligase n=1 Tax=Salimicrobium sp. PL1-032A TaxID=3095364 RepID=UPI00326108EB